MADLNPLYSKEQRQQAFIDHTGGILVALAGPGTGKTYSFLLRINELIENRDVDNNTIIYLTFNREIMHAFKDDLTLKYPIIVTSKPVKASTLHSLACRIIRNKGHEIQLDTHFHILDLTANKDRIAKIAANDILSLLKKELTGLTITGLRGYLNILKTEWRNMEPVDNHINEKVIIEDTYNTYSRSLKLFDWDEVVPIATSLYTKDTNGINWLEKYQHFLIDEYQDFNISEQNFLKLISKSTTSCVVVGDDDQSIYSGRGASPNGIRTLIEDADVDKISLVQCWRCAEQIVKSANTFLSFMHDNPQHLEAVKPGGVVSVKPFVSALAECNYLADYIEDKLSAIDENTIANEGVACLFPSHKVLSYYRNKFTEKGIKCKVRESSELFDDKNWVRIFAKLSYQRNQPFLERLILEKFPEFKPRHKTDVIASLLNGHTSVISALTFLVDNRRWSGSIIAAISEYNRLIQSLTSRDTTQIASCINSVLPNGKECEPSFIDDFLGALASEGEVILEECLDILIDRIYATEDDKPEFEPAVELLTLHSSKGLTRRHIILPGLEHYWLPGDVAGNQLEERKRLFLVGITRATESILITYPRSRARHDSLNLRLPGCLRLSEFARHLSVPEERIYR